MSQTLRGIATVHSILGTISYPAIIANGKLEVMSAPFTHRVDIQERLDANEVVRGFKARNERYEVTVTCQCKTSDFPTTNLAADALKAALLPKKLSVVALSTFQEAVRTGDATTYGAPSINGNYIYKEGGGVEEVADWYKITIPLVKYEHETSANLVAAVS